MTTEKSATYVGLRYFSEADVNFAMAVAEQGGVAIQRAVDYSRIVLPKPPAA